MNNDIISKLVVVVVLSNSALLVGAECQKERPVIEVDWHIANVIGLRFKDIEDENIRRENRRRCVEFGLDDKKNCWYGVVAVRALYNDKKYEKTITSTGTKEDDKKNDWVLLVPTKVIDSEIQHKKITGYVRALQNFASKIFDITETKESALRYDNPKFYEHIAINIGCDPDCFVKETEKCSHPRFIPVGWIVDKKIGDKIDLQAHGCSIKITIKSLPKDENNLSFLKVMSWQKYVYENICKYATKALLVCGLLIVVKHFYKN